MTPWATHLPQQRPIALIVEDDPDLRELAAALLEETDLRVVECEDAEEAFVGAVRDGDDVALIFADIRLPGLLDGVDLARRVKVLWPQITMVVTSGYADARPQALPDSVIYMPKPWLALDVLMQAERAADARARAPRRGLKLRRTITSCIRLRGEQPRDVGGAPLQREALVDVALVGDLVGVDRGRVGQQQHARDALRRARMRGVPAARARAARARARPDGARDRAGRSARRSPISFWQPAALSQHSSAMNSRSAPATIASCSTGEQAASTPTRKPPTCTQVPVVSLKSSASRPSNSTPLAASRRIGEAHRVARLVEAFLVEGRAR